MKKNIRRFIYKNIACLIMIAAILATLPAGAFAALGQGRFADSSRFYQTVNTYVNPVLPGDHPDPTLLKVGNDFYYCGSTFHFNPYLPVYHSRDLVHWEVIARVLPASKAGWVSDHPSAGIWQGAITYFYGSYWIYFSAGGQWVCKARSAAGPWSAPVQVRTNTATGNLGYDNSIFVDDDGKPYMVIKNGQKVNRLQAIGKDGQLTDSVINLDWINARLQYSWAEGPVMCKRNGYYYYFPAGDVSGGQYVLRGTALTGDSTKWVRLGDFFKPVTDAKAGFRRPNHIAAPVQLADGTWWTIGQSYEKYDGDDWSGMGRQTSLYQVIWEGDRPWGLAPSSQPALKPDLPRSGISWRSVRTDYFDSDSLGAWWHFLTKKASAAFTLTERKGWLRLMPGSAGTHIVQKETDHSYTAVTRVAVTANDTADQAGIYLTNGDQHVVVKLYTGYDNGRKVVLKMDTAIRAAQVATGDTVWLKLERDGHSLTGYYSGDGKSWLALGAPVSAVNLDRAQPNFNSWVGTSVGLFAEGKPADFDFFVCKDGRSVIPATGYRNYYGVTANVRNGLRSVTNTSVYGGWFMISGVEIGRLPPSAIEIVGSSAINGKLEIRIDDLQEGRSIAEMAVSRTNEGSWKAFTAPLKQVTGQHDVFVKFPQGQPGKILVKSIRFLYQ